VADAVHDWLARGLKDRDENTIAANRILAEQRVKPLIGAVKLKELTADQVDVRQARERLSVSRRWQDHGYVFASQTGTQLDASHVRRSFKLITKRAGLGENWTPRELRHSFVSLMSDNGVPIETIADLVGHASTAVTEEV
jgi:site-specific recombinase XerD